MTTTPTHKVHTADIAPAPETYTATVSGTLIAKTSEALILQEVADQYTLKPVVYFPADSLNPDYFTKTDHSSHCPLKGDAAYYTITVGDTVLDNAAWYYPNPFDAVSKIKNYVAFYPNKVTIEAS